MIKPIPSKQQLKESSNPWLKIDRVFYWLHSKTKPKTLAKYWDKD